MKIAIVTQYYPPEPVLIPHALAHGLADRGHDVRVVTAYPNYPDGKLADGFRQSWRRCEADGKVTVHRVPIVISHSRNPVGRLLNYASFALSSMSAGRAVRDVDVVYVYATQMTAAVGPTWWLRIRKIPFVLHVQDLWPESITGTSMVGSDAFRRVIDFVLTPWLRGIYKRAASTIAIGPTMARMLRERGVNADRLHTVYNWAEENRLALPEAAARMDKSTHSLNVMYAGNIGDLQDLETVVRAAALVVDLKGFHVHFVGSGVAEERLKALAVKLALANVTFHGRVNPDQMAAYHELSHFQIVSLKNLEIFHGTVPSKLQASLANGVPVITTVAGDVGEIVAENRVGFRSRPEDAERLAESFRAAFAMTDEERTQMGERAREYYASAMSRSRGIESIEKILMAATTAKKRSGHK